jgi:uncharacterized protein (TIGR02246 family)
MSAVIPQEVSMRHFVILTALALCSACQPAPKSQTSSEGAASTATAAAPAGLSAEDEAAIRAVDAEWARAATAGDAKALTAVYASDATLLPPNEQNVKGEGVGKYNADMLSAYPAKMELTTTAVEGRGDLAYSVGSWRATPTPKKAGAKTPPADEGKFLEILKKQSDGSWKIVYDMWSSNAPAAKQ